MPADALQTAGRRWTEKVLSVVPLLLALGTLFVAVMQQSNGLGPAVTVQTLVVGWLLLAPAAALVLWPAPDFVPELSLGFGVNADASEPVDDLADGPVERLRDRYASGDIAEDEFERRIERLLEIDDVTAEESVDRDRDAELE